MKEQRIVDLKVTEMSKNGFGLALLESATSATTQVEIPFTTPGDVIRAKLLGKRRGIFRGELVEILEESPRRIKPRCIHFSVCGGCRFQHISYQDQLQHKENFVRQCFDKSIFEKAEFRPIIACEDPWNYRTKMEYTFYIDENKNKCLGLIKEGSIGRVFDIKECHIGHTWFVEAVKVVKNWWDKSNISAHHNSKGSLYSLTLRESVRTGDRIAILTVCGNPENALSAKDIDGFVAAIKSVAQPKKPGDLLSIFLRIKQSSIGMTTSIYDMLLYGPGHLKEVLNIQVYPNESVKSLQFKIGPADFFQPNPKQTEKFISEALRMAKIQKDAVVYDLYCGIGTIGLCISHYVKQVIGIEFSPESAMNATSNAKANGCNNATFIAGAIRHTLCELKEKNYPAADVVIVNPPRSGLDPEAMQHLLTLKPAKLLYVSCNPVSQAINVAHLQQNGYRTVIIQPVDQFPHTNQVENVVLLELDA